VGQGSGFGRTFRRRPEYPGSRDAGLCTSTTCSHRGISPMVRTPAFAFVRSNRRLCRSRCHLRETFASGRFRLEHQHLSQTHRPQRATGCLAVTRTTQLRLRGLGDLKSRDFDRRQSPARARPASPSKPRPRHPRRTFRSTARGPPTSRAAPSGVADSHRSSLDASAALWIKRRIARGVTIGIELRENLHAA
jgi:hypothetical protein